MMHSIGEGSRRDKLKEKKYNVIGRVSPRDALSTYALAVGPRCLASTQRFRTGQAAAAGLVGASDGVDA